MEAAAKARKLIDELKENERRLQRAGEQGALEERTFLRAQAEALERFHQTEQALQAWRLLAQQYPTTPEGRKAADAVRRLTGAVAATPFLGAGFEGESAVVERVLPGGPADKAGLEPGDRLRTLAGKKVATLDDVRKALGSHKPGDKLKVELDRKGKALILTVEVGALPSEPQP
jgi:predicted metalloprotease with PDZ domain